MTNANDEDDFLARWSRRKAEARQGIPEDEVLQDAEQPSAEAQSAPDAETAEGEAAVPPETFDDVKFDELNFDSDYTRFMKEGVPDMIRRRALRQLWASDPILANLDGLNEYDEDYTDAALAVKALQSAWKPGKGYATDEEIAEREAEAAKSEAESDAEVAAADPHADDEAQDENAEELSEGPEEENSLEADAEVVVEGTPEAEIKDA